MLATRMGESWTLYSLFFLQVRLMTFFIDQRVPGRFAPNPVRPLSRFAPIY